jgi:hypothetical protein
MKENSFNCKYNYLGDIDIQVKKLCDYMNALPGIVTVSSCCGHGKSPLRILFKVVETNVGLFFLTRCVDKRYWKYGNIWKVELSCGDQYVNKELPISYYIHSNTSIGQEAYRQVDSLTENMVLHINHSEFLQLYEINLSEFKLSY